MATGGTNSLMQLRLSSCQVWEMNSVLSKGSIIYSLKVVYKRPISIFLSLVFSHGPPYSPGSRVALRMHPRHRHLKQDKELEPFACKL
jgi:hypothetical protein